MGGGGGEEGDKWLSGGDDPLTLDHHTQADD